MKCIHVHLKVQFDFGNKPKGTGDQDGAGPNIAFKCFPPVMLYLPRNPKSFTSPISPFNSRVLLCRAHDQILNASTVSVFTVFSASGHRMLLKISYMTVTVSGIFLVVLFFWLVTNVVRYL